MRLSQKILIVVSAVVSFAVIVRGNRIAASTRLDVEAMPNSFEYEDAQQEKLSIKLTQNDLSDENQQAPFISSFTKHELSTNPIQHETAQRQNNGIQHEVTRALQAKEIKTIKIDNGILDEDLETIYEEQVVPLGHSKDSEALRYTVAIYLPLAVVFFLLFCRLRLKYPKTYNVRNNVPRLNCDLAKNQFGLFTWVRCIFTQVTEKELLDQCGMDAVCFLRVFDMGCKLSAVAVVLSVVLIPVYKMAPDAEDTASITDRVVKLTVANVPAGSNSLLLTTFAAYVIFGYAMYLALQELNWFTKTRSMFLSRPEIRNYTVYVSGIPRKYRSNEELSTYFRKVLADDCVADATVALHIPRLEAKVAERRKTLFNLEHSVNVERATGIAPTHFNAQLQKVESIAFYKDELDRLNQEISDSIEEIEQNASLFRDDGASDTEASVEDSKFLQEPAPHSSQNPKETNEEEGANPLQSSAASGGLMGIRKQQSKRLLPKTSDLVGRLDVADGTPLNAGFVTFNKLYAATAAKQMVHNMVPFRMDVSEAPDPDFIIWRNVGKSHKSNQLGKLASAALTTILCIFWTVPVSFLLASTEVESLKKKLEFLNEWVETAPWLEPLLGQLAPMVLLLLNSVLLPILLNEISKWEGLVGYSFLEWALFKKLTAFQIIQTFFVASLAGSITAAISYIDGLKELITFLAISLPPQSTFYIQLVTISTVLGLGFEVLRISALLQHLGRKFIGPRLSEKERDMVFLAMRPLSNPRRFLHAQFFAYITLYFMVIFVYATLAPLVCYFLLPCLLTMSVGYRHQLIYIYPGKPDSRGKLWMSFIVAYIACMLVAEVTLIGYLALKEAPAATPLMIPLLIATILFLVYIRQRHFRVASNMSSEECYRVDIEGDRKIDFNSMKGTYRKPALKTKVVIPETPPELFVASLTADTDTEVAKDNSEQLVASLQ